MIHVATFALVLMAIPAHAADYTALPGGRFASVLPADPLKADVAVAPFRLRATPVTNEEFLAFVTSHPEWRRDRTPSVFAEPRYLSQWQSASALGSDALPAQPVTQVSWFAAQAFCESEGASLPTWYEWEFAAAADAARTDARKDPAWRAQILSWYSRPSTTPLPSAGGAANAYGIRDLHGLVWEWVGDFNALLVASDSRDQNDPDRLKFCGAGALNLRDRENYAVLMRVAMLSALKGADTTANLGFRCARDGTGEGS